MIASNFKVGTRFKNKATGRIIVVIEEDNKKYFEEEIWGDLYDYVDEDLYEELY
ncbi:hypothetical protein ACV3UV_11225 [Clostridium perfringens]